MIAIIIYIEHSRPWRLSTVGRGSSSAAGRSQGGVECFGKLIRILLMPAGQGSGVRIRCVYVMWL